MGRQRSSRFLLFKLIFSFLIGQFGQFGIK
jgi:hypothetical protein